MILQFDTEQGWHIRSETGQVLTNYASVDEAYDAYSTRIYKDNDDQLHRGIRVHGGGWVSGEWAPPKHIIEPYFDMGMFHFKRLIEVHPATVERIISTEEAK